MAYLFSLCCCVLSYCLCHVCCLCCCLRCCCYASTPYVAASAFSTAVASSVPRAGAVLLQPQGVSSGGGQVKPKGLELEGDCAETSRRRLKLLFDVLDNDQSGSVPKDLFEQV